jgi:hypothetical protein
MQDVLEIGNSLPLVITGGYAVQAHRLVDRLSRDIDVAANSDIPMEDIVAVKRHVRWHGTQRQALSPPQLSADNVHYVK